MLQGSCGTDLTLAQIISPLGGDINRLPCLLLPSCRRQKTERTLQPDKPSKGFVTRFFPIRRTLVEAKRKSAWVAKHCSFSLKSTRLAKPAVMQVVWYSRNNNLSTRHFGFVTSLFSLVGANSQGHPTTIFGKYLIGRQFEI